MTPYGVWLLILIDLGGIAALTNVALTMLLSQTRIFYAMASDGLLPKFFTKIYSRTETPWISILISGNSDRNTHVLKTLSLSRHF